MKLGDKIILGNLREGGIIVEFRAYYIDGAGDNPEVCAVTSIEYWPWLKHAITHRVYLNALHRNITKYAGRKLRL